MRGSSVTTAPALAALTAVFLIGVPATASARTEASFGPDLPFSSRPSLAREARGKPISAGRLERRLSKLARRAPGASGYYVADLDAAAHAVLFDHHDGKARQLASNEKLFTTSTAMHVLGPEGRIETRVKSDAEVSGDGRLKGDLFLIGGGDPSLGASGMADLARDVERAGVERVSGTVLADDSVFDRLRGVPDTNFEPGSDIAPLSGLVYNGSTYDGDPALEAGKAFKDALGYAGVKIDGKVKVDDAPGKVRGTPDLGSTESDKIAALAAATNKPSNNFFAEMLLKRLAATPKRQGTTKRGTKVVERFVHQLGSDVDARDGSGLTNDNRSSPRDIVRLLTAVRKDEIGDPLHDSLAIAGKDGTLADRMGGTVAEGRCRGKTGTIDGVSNLSGYCRTGKHTVAFSLLMNGVGDYDSARGIQDKMVVEIARYRP